MARILVLAQEECLVRLLEADLQSMRHRARVLDDPRSAPLEAEYWRAELILVDLDAPIDPLDLISMLRTNRSTEGTPIVGITADESSDEVAQAWDLGINFILTKPLNAGDLEDAVKRLLTLESGAA